MNRILQTKNEKDIIIDDLKKEIQTWHSGIENIERSLGKSRMIAAEQQSTANTKAVKILAEAEAIIAANHIKISNIDQEITALHQELDTYSQIIQENLNTAPAPAESFPTAFSPQLLSRQNRPDYINEQLVNNPALITMKLVAFLNAKHYMVFGNKKGATHGHSWQFQVEAAVSVQDSSFVKFEDLDRYINKLIAPYQRSVLNEVAPFDTIEPLTENIAALFFNQLEDDFQKFNVKLIKVTVWENPTKGIEITQRLPQYFSTGSSVVPPVNPPQPTIQAANEAAASKEDENDKINDEDKTVDNPTEPEIKDGAKNSEKDPVCIDKDPKNTENEATAAPESVKEVIHVDNTIEPATIEPVQEIALDPPSSAESLNSGQTDNIRNRNIPLEDKTDRRYPAWQYCLALLVITGVAVWAYWPILTAPPNQIYPWGSDSWCHLFKADFYSEEILKGNYYPQFFPYWHNGVQPFRYWAPLPYFILAVINIFTDNVFIAANYYIAGTAFWGGLAMLVFTKRIGLVPATCAAIVWVFWIDNISVAFSSGNYPRLLAIALLPLLLEAFSRAVESKNKTKYFLFCVILIHFIVLSHAMIAAVYCVALMVFGFLWWVYGGISFKGLFYGGLGLVTGILTSSWWLIPSLTGAGTGFSSEAISANIQFLPFTTTFNPSFRPEEFYWGISLLAIFITVILTWRSRSRWIKSLFSAGILMIFLTLPIFRAIHSILPLHDYLWPFRFSSFWSIAFIICAFSFNKPYLSLKKISTTIVVFVLLFLLSFDSFQTLRLMGKTTTIPEYMLSCANSIEKQPGWKVATLDLSKLSSRPSYFLSESTGREQVHGWAWQGAKTAQNIMLINMALENNWYPYIFQRFFNLGTSDVIILKEVINSPTAFTQYATEAGYIKEFDQGNLSHWHGRNNPYLVVNQNQALAIGKYASIYAMQLPTIEVGHSQNIDDYDLKELQSYQTIILAGSTWSSQSLSEELIKQYARSGGKVLIDLTGFPKDIFSRQSMFLGVYGEPIAITKSINVSSKTGNMNLMPFAQEDWRCLAPQGLDKLEYTFSHYGNDAVLLGSKTVAPNVSVQFIGANLAYHAFLTHDSVASKILQEALQLSGDYQKPTLIDIENYHTMTNGYTMSYYAEHDFQAIIPVAALDGMQTQVDGKKITTNIYENLILADLPAGQHTITLVLKEAPIYPLSRYISVFSLLLMLGGIYSVQPLHKKKGKTITPLVEKNQ